MRKRSFPHPFSTPDDWLREVLEFFPADSGANANANANTNANAKANVLEGEGKGEGAPSRFLINSGGHYMPSTWSHSRRPWPVPSAAPLTATTR